MQTISTSRLAMMIGYERLNRLYDSIEQDQREERLERLNAAEKNIVTLIRAVAAFEPPPLLPEAQDEEISEERIWAALHRRT